MQATPNNGTTYNSGYSTTSPQLNFEVNFVKTGTHWVWLRGAAAANVDDSCHIGLDGSEVTTSDRIEGFGTSWSWTRDTMDGPVATFNVPSAGVHTINLWMREDGLSVDKLVHHDQLELRSLGHRAGGDPRHRRRTNGNHFLG